MIRLIVWKRVMTGLLAVLCAGASLSGERVKVAVAASPDVVISQVYGGGGNTGASYTNDYIVLFNRGAAAVPVNGWSVQYAAATGTSWNVTPISGNIQPGQSYLIQQASTAAIGAALPTPDATGTATMAANNGKVALVTNTTALTCGAALGSCAASVKDLVGYGIAMDSETAPAPAPSNTTAIFRAANGCTDTDNNSTNFSAAAPAPKNTAAAAVPCGSTPAPAPGSDTPISTIQGSGSASPLVGQVVTTKGIVTRLYPDGGTPNSLFIQDAGDGNPATSDGLFIFNNAAIPTTIVVGDEVQVTGTVTEFNGLTELATITALSEVPVAVTITPATLTLPVATNDGLEAYEDMLVTIPQTMTVSQNYFQGRYGQLTLSANGRLRQPTNIFRPNTPEALAENDSNIRRTLILDDGRTSQNPNPIPYIGADTTNRAGDTVAGLTGVIDFGPINAGSPPARFYRLQPTVPLANITFTRTNPRGKPENVGGNLKVASANVLNYFTTLDATGNTCYTSSGPAACRGANTAAEFTRQRTKIISELLTLDADVFGLMEIENNGTTAVGDLVSGLNAIAGAGTYAIVPDPTNDPITDTTRLGGDAIKVAMIYKPGRVTLQGAALSSPDPVFSRAPFAQTFKLNSTGSVFSVIVNHFKSKGSCPTSASDPNADMGDGQGCWNALRVQQAQAQLTLINQVKAAAGSDDLLVIGDLNAYGQEDPIKVLTDGGLVNQLAKRIANPYSYVFDGLAGYLDHALTTASLDSKVSGITEWHNNADETSVIDYNTEFKPQDLYTPTPYRATDHDPVLIGLNLGEQRVYLPLAVK